MTYRGRVHDLKTWPAPFEAVWSELKRHELRKDDRGYAVGDFLLLKEYDPGDGMYLSGKYTGRAVLARVTYLSAGGTWGLPPGLCVMSIVNVDSVLQYTIGIFDGAILRERERSSSK